MKHEKLHFIFYILSVLTMANTPTQNNTPEKISQLQNLCAQIQLAQNSFTLLSLRKEVNEYISSDLITAFIEYEDEKTVNTSAKAINETTRKVLIDLINTAITQERMSQYFERDIDNE